MIKCFVCVLWFRINLKNEIEKSKLWECFNFSLCRNSVEIFIDNDNDNKYGIGINKGIKDIVKNYIFLYVILCL